MDGWNGWLTATAADKNSGSKGGPAEPRRGKPSRAKPTRAKRSRARPNRAKPNRPELRSPDQLMHWPRPAFSFDTILFAINSVDVTMEDEMANQRAIAREESEAHAIRLNRKRAIAVHRRREAEGVQDPAPMTPPSGEGEYSSSVEGQEDDGRLAEQLAAELVQLVGLQHPEHRPVARVVGHGPRLRRPQHRAVCRRGHRLRGRAPRPRFRRRLETRCLRSAARAVGTDEGLDFIEIFVKLSSKYPKER